jgi:outer membrane protein assembly factor BamD
MAKYFLVVVLMAGLLASCGFKRKKYDNPITKDTKQPDKVLFDRAIDDIEHGRYEVARITLNTLINTYDQSEFLAKAKLAVADSWYREGGAAGLAQAEAEYKDFILFYPTMEEAAESQQKVCMIHYKQMDKADRDPNQALRAEDECRQLIVQFPNSKFVDETQQLLRNIQEALADGEYKVGFYYYKRGSNFAAANRYAHLVDQYPLYSKADEALFELGDSYARLGSRFRTQEGEAFARIVRDYPLSDYADSAKKRLQELEMTVPEADPKAVARMQYEKDNRQKVGMVSKATGLLLKRGPDVSAAARSGAPAMTTLRPPVPLSVPQTGAPGFTGDVTATTVSDSTALDTKPDARANPPAPGSPAAAAGQPATDAAGKPVASPAAANPASAGTAATGNPQSQPQSAADQAKAQKKKKKDKKPKQPVDTTQPAAAPASSSSSATPPKL